MRRGEHRRFSFAGARPYHVLMADIDYTQDAMMAKPPGMGGAPSVALHVVINVSQIPKEKLAILLEYLLGRAGGSPFVALNVVSDKKAVGGFRYEELRVDPSWLNEKGKERAEERIKAYLESPNRISFNHAARPQGFSSATILGVGHPDKLDFKTKLYGRYKNVSGLGDIGGLAAFLRDRIVSDLLAPGGRIRVQVCHADSAKPPGNALSFAKIIAGAHPLSAPPCFSVVHPSGAFLDVACTMDDFKKIACKKFLRAETHGKQLQLPSTIVVQQFESNNPKLIAKNKNKDKGRPPKQPGPQATQTVDTMADQADDGGLFGLFDDDDAAATPAQTTPQTIDDTMDDPQGDQDDMGFFDLFGDSGGAITATSTEGAPQGGIVQQTSNDGSSSDLSAVMTTHVLSTHAPLIGVDPTSPLTTSNSGDNAVAGGQGSLRPPSPPRVQVKPKKPMSLNVGRPSSGGSHHG